MLLVDASIPPQRMDLECANWLAEALVRDGLIAAAHCWGVVLLCLYCHTCWACRRSGGKLVARAVGHLAHADGI